MPSSLHVTDDDMVDDADLEYTFDPSFLPFQTTADEKLRFLGSEFEPAGPQNGIGTDYLTLPQFYDTKEEEIYCAGAGITAPTQDVDVTVHLAHTGFPVNTTEGGIGSASSDFSQLCDELVRPVVDAVTAEEYRHPLEPEPELEPQPRPWPKHKPCTTFQSEDRNTWKAYPKLSDVPPTRKRKSDECPPDECPPYQCPGCGWWYLEKKLRDRCWHKRGQNGERKAPGYPCVYAKNGCQKVYTRNDNSRTRHSRKCPYRNRDDQANGESPVAASKYSVTSSPSTALHRRTDQGLSTHEHDTGSSMASSHMQIDDAVFDDTRTSRAVTLKFEHELADETCLDPRFRQVVPQVEAAGSSVRGSTIIRQGCQDDRDNAVLEGESPPGRYRDLSHNCTARAPGCTDSEMPDAELQLQQALLDNYRVNRYRAGRPIDPDSPENARNKRRAI